MSVQAFDPAAASVQVTDAAAQHFRAQITQDAAARAVRLSVKQAGCTGWKYVVDLVAEATTGDQVIALGDGLELFVDPAALAVVSGTEIDFVTQGVNKVLVFNNPHVKDYCGCGESFNVAE